MRIVYCHHALRDMGNPPSIDDGIRELGIKDASVVGEILEDARKYFDIKAIYTSPYKRCVDTARIINEKLNVSIIDDDRLNECGSVYHDGVKETWEECQRRVIDFIKAIVNKYDENDTVVCVTSGINITAFICVVYGIQPSNDLPIQTVLSCSPVVFKISKANLINL